MQINEEICNGCGLCVKDCPLNIIRLEDKKAIIDAGCVECRTCLKVCPSQAVSSEPSCEAGTLTCRCCPVACRIPDGGRGACARFVHHNGRIVRSRPLLAYEAVAPALAGEPVDVIKKPLITAIGAGGTYPDCVPAPYIVSDIRDGVDVVTVVTEVPLSYSGLKVKIDTDRPVGKEGAAVTFEGRSIGMVETEEYGSKILALGGVNRLTGKAGFAAARAVAAIANREAAQLSVKGGANLALQVGRPPVIDGVVAARMRVGCGSATIGLFTHFFDKAADEIIVLDSHITALFTHHAAGRHIGRKPLGVELVYRLSTPGRYFGRHGDGWGGTDIVAPLDIISAVDMTRTPPGTTLLVTETTGERAAMYRLNERGSFDAIPLTPTAEAAISAIAETCESSRVSAVYVGGAGGSARAGAVRYPLRLTRAVHERRAVLTCGGAPVFLLPGGGITFYVDVEQVQRGAFTWVPTPATVAPVEYTMRLDHYKAMGGHVAAVQPYKTVKPGKHFHVEPS